MRHTTRREGVKVRTDVKAGGFSANRNETLVRATVKARGVKLKTNVKAGIMMDNHNEKLIRDRA
jgi:hypothetical protein